MIRHTTPPEIRLAIENGKLPSTIKEKLAKVIKAHKKAVSDSDVLYNQLTKAANMEGGDNSSIAGAKRAIVVAVKSSKNWVQVFEMYNQFETDEDSNPLSEAKIIDDIFTPLKSAAGAQGRRHCSGCMHICCYRGD